MNTLKRKVFNVIKNIYRFLKMKIIIASCIIILTHEIPMNKKLIWLARIKEGGFEQVLISINSALRISQNNKKGVLN